MARPRKRIRTFLLASAAAALVVFAGMAAGYALVIVPDLPQLRDEPPDVDLGSIVYAADGAEIGRFYYQDRIWVPYREISPHVVNALLATEDHRFYEHEGVDYRRTLAAVYHSLRGDVQGGSTISMQLARNLFPREIGSARTPVRKIKEIITAIKLERNFSKQEILEMYLNTVPFGNNAFGIESAARRYFSHSAGNLEPDEAALLVGLLKGTSWYNPLRHPERALARRDLVLQRMHRHGYLSSADLDDARSRSIDIDFQFGDPAGTIAPHFTDHVRLVAGEWADRNGYDLYTDGLRIHTTLDSELQQVANQAVARQVGALHAAAAYEWSRSGTAGASGSPSLYQQYLDEGRFSPFAYLWQTRGDLLDAHIRRTMRYRDATRRMSADEAISHLTSDAAFVDSLKSAVARLEGGLVAIDPATGYVKAWVGGRDYRADKYDKVAQARRQPGSTFKPFVYAAAIDFGFSPYHTFKDSLITINLPGSRRTWTPRNAGGGASGAELSLRDALVYSKNTITAQLVNDLGPHHVATFARRMGINSRLDPVPSIGLGTSEASLLEMTSAYATIAAHGVRTTPIVITRIEDRNGRELARFGPTPEKAISSYTAYTLLDMMRGVIDHGTGAAVRHQHGIRGDLAGKTGTSQHYADGWFIMMHPRLVTGAWVGFNDRRITFRTSRWGQGGRNALHVVGDFFSAAMAIDSGLSEQRFQPPSGYVEPRDPEAYDPYLYALESGDEDGDDFLRDAFYEGLDDGRTEDSLLHATSGWPDARGMGLEDPDERGSASDPDADAEATLRARIREAPPVQRVEPLPADTTADDSLLTPRHGF